MKSCYLESESPVKVKPIGKIVVREPGIGLYDEWVTRTYIRYEVVEYAPGYPKGYIGKDRMSEFWKTAKFVGKFKNRILWEGRPDFSNLQTISPK